MKLFRLALCVLIAGLLSAHAQVEIVEAMRPFLPNTTRISIDADPDSLEYPMRSPRPAFNLIFEDTAKTFNRYPGAPDPSLWETHPTFKISLYPISMEPELRKSIAANNHLSDCIPSFFAENPVHFALTSPCYYIRECGQHQCMPDLDGILSGLQAYFASPTGLGRRDASKARAGRPALPWISRERDLLGRKPGGD